MNAWKLQRRLVAERMLEPATPFVDHAEAERGTDILARVILIPEFEILAWDYQVVSPAGETLDLTDFMSEESYQ